MREGDATPHGRTHLTAQVLQASPILYGVLLPSQQAAGKGAAAGARIARRRVRWSLATKDRKTILSSSTIFVKERRAKTQRRERILGRRASAPVLDSLLACLMMNESPASDQQTMSSGTFSTILYVRSKKTGMLLKGSSCSETPPPAAFSSSASGAAPPPGDWEPWEPFSCWLASSALPLSLTMMRVL